MASESLRISRWCVAAFGFGVISFTCATVGFYTWSNYLSRIGIACWALTLVTGAIGLSYVSQHRGYSRGGLLALWGMGLPAAFFMLMLLFMSSAQEVRNGFHTQTIMNLKQIALAFHNFHDSHKRVPAAAICDGESRPLLSWRVAILPFIEEEQLYQAFKLDEAWDSPHNMTLLDRKPFVYRVDHRDIVKTHNTFFQVFAGPGTPFEPGLVCKIPGSFPDGTSNTLLVVEAADAVPWTKPEDLSYHPDGPLPPLGSVVPRARRIGVADLFGFGPSPVNTKSVFVALADGSARVLNLDTISEQTLRRAIVRNDGKEMGPDW